VRMPVSQALLLARQRLQAARYDDAQAICEALVAADAQLAEAHRLWGVVDYCRGDFATAGERLQRAIALDPHAGQSYADLAAVHNAQGDFVAAAIAGEQAVELCPQSGEACNNLGNAYRALGRYAEAEAAYRRALATQASAEVGRYNRAVAEYNLGRVLRAVGRRREALAAYRRALEHAPHLAEAESNLGELLNEMGRPVDAEAACRRALTLKPGLISAAVNLGVALQAQSRLDEAVEALEDALRRDPANATAWCNLGGVRQAQGRYAAAVAANRQALQLDPQLAEGQMNLGAVLQAAGLNAEAQESYRRTLQLRPTLVTAHSNLLSALNYDSDVSPEKLCAAHRDWDRQHAAALRADWPTHGNSRDPDRPLRIGFVSADFGRHPVGYFLVGVLEHLDRRSIAAYCYSDRIRQDVYTQRLRAASARWCDVRELSDAELAAQIRDDQIDVLFDLAGHTGENRLLVFARKPAPLQVTWMGYVGTTGLAAMDYLLADAQQIAPGTEEFYVEQILRMPDGYVCYAPPADAPEVAPPPCAATGRITFGSFNNPAKINRRVLELWAGILDAVPHSRLLLRYNGLGDELVQSRIREGLTAGGIAAQRVEFLGPGLPREMLESYAQIDVALDPFPYSGGLTTCEALWMGVPVVTCPGQTFASRHALTHLLHAGLGATIAGDFAEYARLAVTLANDRPRLAALRGGLRAQMAESPLCDAPRFGRQWSEVMRGIWRRWCAGADERGAADHRVGSTQT